VSSVVLLIGLTRASTICLCLCTRPTPFPAPRQSLRFPFLIFLYAPSSNQSTFGWPEPDLTTDMTNPLSRHSSQPPEDWDHPESTIDPSSSASSVAPAPTSRIVFPSSHGGTVDDDDAPPSPTSDAPHPSHRRGGRSGKRTLSELLKLHAEKGTNVHFTAEEAARLEDVLGQWINSGSSPYEDEDEFFTRSCSHDDSIVLVHRSSTFNSIVGCPPHGQNESIALES